MPPKNAWYTRRFEDEKRQKQNNLPSPPDPEPRKDFRCRLEAKTPGSNPLKPKVENEERAGEESKIEREIYRYLWNMLVLYAES